VPSKFFGSKLRTEYNCNPIGTCNCAAGNRSLPTQAAAANAPEAFKKLRREEIVIREVSNAFTIP